MGIALNGLEISGVTYSANQIITAGAVAVGCFVVGALASPLIVRIGCVVRDAFSRIADYFASIPFVLRVRSMFCDDCAIRHRAHIIRNGIESEQQNEILPNL